MNKLEKTFLTLLVSFILFSCKKNKSVINTENSVKIDLSDKEVKISDISKLLEIKEVLSLKGVEKEDFIYTANRIEYFNNNIYLLDSGKSNLLVFDSNGNFVNKIGKRGVGPEEFRGIDDFEIDRINNEIYLLSQNDIAILVFDLNGSFLRRIRFDSFYPKSFDLFNSEFLIFDSGYDDSERKNVTITSLDGNIISKKFPYPKDLLQMSFAYTGGVNNDSESSFYSDATSSKIYKLDSNLNYNEKFNIDFGTDSWPEDQRYNYDLFKKKSSLYEISFLTNNYIINNKGFIFNYVEGSKMIRCYYNINSNTSISQNNINEKEILNLFGLPVGFKNNNFISIVTNELYFELRDYYPNLDDKIKEFNPNLYNKISTFNSSSDPILLIYNFK